MLQSDLISIIETIEKGCIQARKEPVCAPLIEILRKCTPEQKKTVRDTLNELYKGGKIRVWNAINDTMIKLVDNHENQSA